MAVMNISFDLWGTLIKNNPLFAEKRLDLIRKDYKLDENTLALLPQQFKYWKNHYDAIIERSGLHIDRRLIYHQILPDLALDDLEQLIAKLDDLFVAYPPLLLPYAAEVLEALHPTHQLFLSSNTLLMAGVQLKKAMETLGIAKYFSAFRFSDELGYSKPHHSLFYPNSHYHVGDNIRTDGACEQFGIHYFQVHSNAATLLDFQQLLATL